MLDHVKIVKVMGLHQRRKSRDILLYFIVDWYKIYFLYKNQDYIILPNIILYYLLKLYSVLIYSFYNIRFGMIVLIVRGRNMFNIEIIFSD